MDEKKNSCFGTMFLLVLGFIVICFFLVPKGMLVDEDVAIRALETQGFSDVKIVDRQVYFISCKGGGEGDDVRFTCLATNPAGQKVTVYVFAGWPFKGATVRTP